MSIVPAPAHVHEFAGPKRGPTRPRAEVVRFPSILEGPRIVTWNLNQKRRIHDRGHLNKHSNHAIVKSRTPHKERVTDTRAHTHILNTTTITHHATTTIYTHNPTRTTPQHRATRQQCAFHTRKKMPREQHRQTEQSARERQRHTERKRGEDHRRSFGPRAGTYVLNGVDLLVMGLDQLLDKRTTIHKHFARRVVR